MNKEELFSFLQPEEKHLRSYIPSPFIVAGLPARDVKNLPFQRKYNDITLTLNGLNHVPYGKYGRLLLTILTTHAVLSKNSGEETAKIEYKSLSNLLKELQLPRSRGKDIREQLEYFSRAAFIFEETKSIKTKNQVFRDYVSEVAAQALDTEAKDIEGFMKETWKGDASLTVEQKLSTMIATIGENMHIRRFEVLEDKNGFVQSYIHAGGKIGVLLDVESDVVNDELKEMAKNVCMQVAALKPLYTSSNEVGADYIAKEKEILKAQIMNDPKEAAKPEKVIEGMIAGRINKELKEIVLLDQVYVKAEDGKQTVKQYVDSVAKANNAKVTVKKFVRFETGEGLEHRNDDFAAEVAAQMGK